jgi:hypothetical protein
MPEFLTRLGSLIVRNPKQNPYHLYSPLNLVWFLYTREKEEFNFQSLTTCIWKSRALDYVDRK